MLRVIGTIRERFNSRYFAGIVNLMLSGCFSGSHFVPFRSKFPAKASGKLVNRSGKQTSYGKAERRLPHTKRAENLVESSHIIDRVAEVNEIQCKIALFTLP